MNNKEHTKSIILVLLVLMSIVLTYMVWNFSPDLSNIDNTDNSKSDKPKPLTKPMTAEMEGTITPFQIVHSRDDKSQGTVASGAVLDKMIQPLKNQEVKSVSHLKREHNLVIP
ncbi:two-component system activity regulator YycH, partial [Escherichia coli]